MKRMTLFTTTLAATVFALVFVQTAGAEQYQQQQRWQQQQQWQQQSQADVQRVSELMERKVTDTQGNTIGTVKDVAFSERGQPMYLVLSPEDIQGVSGDQLLPIPWHMVTLNPQQKEVTVSVNKNMLRNAPTFSENDWRQLGERSFEGQVFGYYGRQQSSPYYGQREMYQRGMGPYQQQQPYERGGGYYRGGPGMGGYYQGGQYGQQPYSDYNR